MVGSDKNVNSSLGFKDIETLSQENNCPVSGVWNMLNVAGGRSFSMKSCAIS